jgi:phosphoenolpyruvate carboxykinase (GTP)
MLPFCGYNMADYWNHWLNIGRQLSEPPRVFRVNWFRRDEKGKFIWPGFGENMRVLKWILDRVHGRGYGVESPMGFMPRLQDIHWEGLDYDPETFYKLMAVDREKVKLEASSHEEFFEKFYDRLPKEFIHHRELFKSRLWRSPIIWKLEGALF